MSREHLFSLRLGHALRESLRQKPYNRQRLVKDLIAGVTVGIIAIPLSMALAIASGVAPQYGLYTAIIAGVLIALTGGSRYSVSGPTAAFVVILFPIAEKFGLGGLLMATFLSGFVLIAMALLRLGRFVEYIPQSVTLGFTSGIGIVIATLQLKDFVGLDMSYPASYVDKLTSLAYALPSINIANFFVGVITLLCLIYWKRFSRRIPPHIPALFVGVIIAALFNAFDVGIDTIGTRFSFINDDGSIGWGIPSGLPEFMWPWQQPNAHGEPIGFSWTLLELLLPAAFSIAMLGAIESLLCAVVLDNMTKTRHSANSELLGQGLGNLVAPLFGGITATAAIARSAANVKAGAETPLAAVVQGLFVLAGLLILAPILAYLPMASMAAILLLVAWQIANIKGVFHYIRTAPMGDIWVLLTCLSLTVLFDMVIAIGIGVVLAALLFMKEISQLTKVSDVSGVTRLVPQPLPEGWSVFKIQGPLFFAAADRVFSDIIRQTETSKGIILYMDAVTILDAGGYSALQHFIQVCHEHNTQVIITDLQFQPLKTIAKARLMPVENQLYFTSVLVDALEKAHNLAVNDDALTSDEHQCESI